MAYELYISSSTNAVLLFGFHAPVPLLHIKSHFFFFFFLSSMISFYVVPLAVPQVVSVVQESVKRTRTDVACSRRFCFFFLFFFLSFFLNDINDSAHLFKPKSYER